MTNRTRGNRRLKDGDTTFDECPDCGSLLRVRRVFAAPIILECPCGYSIPVTLITDSAPEQDRFEEMDSVNVCACGVYLADGEDHGPCEATQYGELR